MHISHNKNVNHCLDIYQNHILIIIGVQEAKEIERSRDGDGDRNTDTDAESELLRGKHLIK